MERIKITLNEEEYRALVKQCEKNLRPVPDEARFIIRQALQQATPVEKLEAFNQRLESALTELTGKLDLLGDGALIQGSAIAHSQGRLDALEEVARNAAVKRERLETTLADLSERIAALERHIEEDHAREVQP